MAQTITFPSTTPNLNLPLLFSGQAQKEFTLNQALASLDALAFQIVEGTAISPPPNASEGQCFIVGEGATGGWTDCTDCIALRIAEDWHIVTPREGIEVFDKSTARKLVFRSGWQSATSPTGPTGGTVVDQEVRTALVQLLGQLQNIGILGEAT